MSKLLVGVYKHILLVCLLLVQFQFVKANERKLDSLRKELLKTSVLERQELYSSLANYFIEEEENDSAIKYLDLLIGEEADGLELLDLAEAYRNLGLLYQYKGQFKKANEYNFRGLSIKEEINAPAEAMASSHSNIALSFQELGNFSKAIEHQKIALAYSIETNDSLRVGERYNLIGGIFYQLENYDSALVYFNSALAINRKLGNREFLSMHQIYIGLIHMKKDRLFMAQEAFEKSLADFPENGAKRMKVFIYSNLAVVHLVIGAERDSIGEYHLSNSVDYALKTYQLAEELSFLRQMRKSSEILYKAYEALGDYEKAMKHSKEYIALNDSMYKEQEQKAIAEMQTKYDTEKKEAEIAYLDRENSIKEENLTQAKVLQKTQRWVIFILLFAILLIASLLIWVYRIYIQKKKANEELRQKNTIISQQKEEREVLLKEIHHRVKNNLQVVSSLLDLQINDLDDESTILAIEDGQSRVKAMALIHQNLYQNQDIGTVSFKEYVSQLSKQLASIYKAPNQVNVELNISEVYFDIDTAIPLGLILNELISNAYKYAFQTKKGTLGVELKKLTGDQGYDLIVKDSGAGLAENFEIKKSKSLGLRLVRRLSRQLYGKAVYFYENGATFKIHFKDTSQRKKVQ